MKCFAIVVGGIALATYAFAQARADEGSSAVDKSQLACMGLSALRPMSDAAGDEVRGNCPIFGGSGPFGIPLNATGARLVVRLNWSYYEVFPDLRTVILLHLLETGQHPEPIPPGRLDF